MELLYILLVLLVVTRACGELSERLGQPVLVGELISGVGLGLVVSRYSDAFPVLADLQDNEVFHGITELGMFFLMLLAGVELRPRDLVKASKQAVFIALGGMLLPLALGLALGWAILPESHVKAPQALFIGTCLAITAVPVSVKILIDLGKLKSRLGRVVVAAALVDDVLSLLLLAVLTSVLESGAFPGPAGLALLLGKVLAFAALVMVCGNYALPAVGRRMHRLRAAEFEFSLLLIAALGFSVLAEALGMHFILGAFSAGLFFGRRTIDEQSYVDVREKVSAISTGFMAPIFFASLGFHLELRALWEAPGLVVALITLATLGKLLGTSLPARYAGFSRRESMAVGVAMNARGAVELVVAGVALEAGLFQQPTPIPPSVANLFSAVVLMAIVTTLATPIALERLIGGREQAEGASDATAT